MTHIHDQPLTLKLADEVLKTDFLEPSLFLFALYKHQPTMALIYNN